jgi:uncharacterized protein YndB with AHSA1/START domain
VKLHLEQQLDVSAAAAWRFLVDPEKMNLWSDARITLLAVGDADEPGGVGAMRRITIRALGRESAFDEVIEVSEPPHRLVYRVVRGLPIRDHRGEITIVDQPSGGSKLTWTVDADFLVPGLGVGAGMVLRAQLQSSLIGLQRVSRGGPHAPVALAPPKRVDAELDLEPLWAQAKDVLERQRKLAERLREEGDPKAWFTRVYVLVTENQIALCRSGKIAHPGWVLRLIPRFHHYYVDNLLRARGERPGHAEEHWRHAFRGMERARRRMSDQGMAVVWGILRGAEAHIEEDLPRALADVYIEAYADVCSYARFRADYVLMAGVFRDAGQRIVDEMPKSYVPAPLRYLFPILPLEVKDAVFNRRYYDVPRARLKAFERGSRLVAWRRGERPPEDEIT